MQVVMEMELNQHVFVVENQIVGLILNFILAITPSSQLQITMRNCVHGN